jgi:hypothetical protein
VARLLPIALVVALLVGTAAAFAVTERLKLVKSPIAAPEIDRVFSPVCDCDRDAASVAFRLREGDRADLAIVDEDGDVVRTLFESRSVPRGRVEASWDGRDDEGDVVPEGRYRPRVHLDRQRRTIVLPNPIEVDVTAPVAQLVSVAPTVFSPDGDGRSDKVTVRYRMSEPANAVLLVDGEQRVRTRFAPVEDKLDWFGVVDGKPLRRGFYELQVVGVDRAGNRSEPTEGTRVRIRSIDLARALVRVPPRVRFGIGVDTDARSYRWRFAGGSGRASGPLLVLRAPVKPGRYTIFVEANGGGDRATVLVRAR